MKKLSTLTLCVTVALILAACGGTSNDSENKIQSSSENQFPVKLSESKLTKFMLEDTVCNILSIDSIKNTYNVTTEIKAEASTNRYSSGVTCNYSWEKADAEERKNKLLSSISSQMNGTSEKISMREKVLESNISIKIEEYSGQAERFMPAKLTEEQLQKQIDEAQKRANDRLSESQKKLAGSAANSMVERMLRQNNMNEVVADVGDKAYWSPVAGGGLYVLSGNTKAFISLMVADTEAEDKENAKKIAELILQN